MKIFPAIDIRDGKVVRLTQGDYERMNVYSDNPLEFVEKFKIAGATHLHLVDLDGAKDNQLVNYDTIKKIVQNNQMFVEVGGGIRDEERINKYLELGVARLILGTVAVKNFQFVADMTKKYGSVIAVGVDAINNLVAINGWTEVTDINSVEFCRKLADIGVSNIVYTDISKDGKMSGTNLEIYEELSSIDTTFTASGGITYLEEIKSLCDMKVYGAILGKALYEGKLELSEAIQIGEKL